ncbi:MAG: glycosyltransferase [Oscillospiraceae bacterium]|nr:glycosyltransferase [Oscillospiraceae bacterium]
MNDPKISIVVPVYKVEPYLRKCLDSIVNQTYRNLEIILVDDGSPDNCPAICDEYAARDERIVVIHQKNGGLSAARNSALDISTGEYLGFVDSDDWIEPDMFEYLLTNMCSVDADIGFCGHIEEYPNRSKQKCWPQAEVMDRENALKNLLEDKTLHNYVWDKLWKRELFNGVRFPAGKTFEDMAVVHRPFINAQRVVFLPEAKYHYLQRPGSILADASIRNRINFFLAAQQRYDEMIVDWPQFRPLLEAQCLATTVHIWSGYWFSPKETRTQYKEQLWDIAAFARPRLQTALQHTHLGLAGRLVLRLVPYATGWSFTAAGFIGWLYKLRHGRVL